MKVALGTIEVNDDVRRLIRRVQELDGLATRDEIRDLVAESFRDTIRGMIDMDEIRMDFGFSEDDSDGG